VPLQIGSRSVWRITEVNGMFSTNILALFHCPEPRGNRDSKKGYRVEKFFSTHLGPPLPPPPSIKGRKFPPLAADRSFRSGLSSPSPPVLGHKVHDVFAHRRGYCSSAVQLFYRYYCIKLTYFQSHMATLGLENQSEHSPNTT
jgi:hypothetical protein